MSPAQPSFDQPGVTWSVRVQGVQTGRVLLDHSPDTVLPTASIGKILLLLTVAEQMTSGRISPDERVSRSSVEPVADSGLWQHLAVDTLAVVDVARLVAAVSDNLATNVLIERVSLAAIDETTRRLGLVSTALHDVVRDERTPDHPPALSSGSAAELVRLCRDVERDQALAAATSAQVRDWLRLDTDLSMVAAAFGLDPLAHVGRDRGMNLWNKTGTNTGVRCDVGVVRAAGDDTEPVAYAALAHWTPTRPADPVRDDVLTTMRDIGTFVRAVLPDSLG